MSRQPSEAGRVAPEMATVYLSMADLVRAPGDAAPGPIDPLKTCIGLGPDDLLVVPKRERSGREDVARAAPVVRQGREGRPVQRWLERYVEHVASAARHLRLESRVWMVCWRLRAAGRYSRSTLAGARRWWVLGVAGALVIGVLGMARMGEGAVGEPAAAEGAVAEAAAAPAIAPAAVADSEAELERVPAGAVEVVGAGAVEAAALPPARTTLARAAADATAGARYALALDYYRQLLLNEPGNAAYASMIVALERRVSASTKAR